MKVRFLYPAFVEYKSGIEYYNTLQIGLGDKFIKEVDQYIEIIKLFPQSFPVYVVNTRKVVLNTFPYNIIYSIVEDEILIHAIAHQHRYPDYWQNS
ncbi:MAG: type II toxin-antitoxin system RelE/ParE family toxin [Ignavibacteriota bacterium]